MAKNSSKLVGRINDTWSYFFKRHPYGMLSLCLICLCGSVGVLVDIDHLLLFIGFEDVGLEGRPLHTTMLAIAGVLLVGCCAYLGRCVRRMVLKSKEK